MNAKCSSATELISELHLHFNWESVAAINIGLVLSKTGFLRYLLYFLLELRFPKWPFFKAITRLLKQGDVVRSCVAKDTQNKLVIIFVIWTSKIG